MEDKLSQTPAQTPKSAKCLQYQAKRAGIGAIAYLWALNTRIHTGCPVDGRFAKYNLLYVTRGECLTTCLLQVQEMLITCLPQVQELCMEDKWRLLDQNSWPDFLRRYLTLQSYFTINAYKPFLQKLIPSQIRQLILYISNDQK